MIDTKFKGADNKHLFAVFDGHGQVTVTVMVNGASTRWPRSGLMLVFERASLKASKKLPGFLTKQHNTK
jgi:hypothetical protein